MTDTSSASSTQPVVVGYDASQASAVALRWAAEAATKREARLIVLHAAGWEHPQFTPQEVGVAEKAQRAAQGIAEQGAERAREMAPGLTIEAVGVLKGAPAALQKYSRGASLVVIGNRGRGKIRGALMGSVAFAVSAHALCPVVVVRTDNTPAPAPSHPVVVGIDGSEHSKVALDHAAELAARNSAPLRIVAAWQRPSWNPWTPAGKKERPAQEPAADVAANPWQILHDTDPRGAQSIAEQVPRTAADVAERAVQRVSANHPGLTVEQLVGEGEADQVITTVAKEAGASLIVVGARGRGDLASLLLGSVSRSVIHRAECPVLVVR